jgi:hypothetical protein
MCQNKPSISSSKHEASMIAIEIKVTDRIVIDAGTIEETADRFTINPPSIAMIDQLVGAEKSVSSRFFTQAARR